MHEEEKTRPGPTDAPEDGPNPAGLAARDSGDGGGAADAGDVAFGGVGEAGGGSERQEGLAAGAVGSAEGGRGEVTPGEWEAADERTVKWDKEQSAHLMKRLSQFKGQA